MKGGEFMFFNRKNKVINESVLDLRKYTPQALENVRMLNCSCVIFSENPSEELMTAYGNISVKNVSATLNLPDDKKIVLFNGATTLNQANYTENAIHMINGAGVIGKIESENPVEIFSNGLTVYDGGTKINFIMQNGACVKAPFEIKDVKLFSTDAKVDSLFVENLKDNTVVAAGTSMVIYNDVSLELLKSKQIYFVAGTKIKCDADILGYIQTIATAGVKIEVNE